MWKSYIKKRINWRSGAKWCFLKDLILDDSQILLLSLLSLFLNSSGPLFVPFPFFFLVASFLVEGEEVKAIS